VRPLLSLCAPLAIAMAWWLAWPEPVRSHGTLTTTVLFDR
jgi:hypothetical protein